MPINLKGSGILDADGDILSRSGGAPAGVSRAALAADVAFTGTFVPQEAVQSGTTRRVFEVLSGADDALASVDVMEYANLGAGAGTFNHAMHIGFNAGRHSAGSVTATRPAVYMGFEDDYFDSAGDLEHGAEWYTGYVSPDGTSVAVGDLRPLYWRAIDSSTNDVDKSVIMRFDIGSGADASFTLWGSAVSGDQLLSIDHDQALFSVPLNVVGNGQYGPLTGHATLLLKANQATKHSILTFQPNGGAAKFQFVADQFNEIYLWDNTNSRVHINWVQGASVTAALTDISSSVKIGGNVGFYGTTPVTKPTGVAVTAAGIHAALVTLGLIAA